MRIFVAGGGQSAEFIARRLIREGNQLVILETDGERCKQLESHLDAKVVQGNAGSFTAWRRAGIAAAEMVIAATDSDETNVLTCLIAATEVPDAIKAVRLRTREFRDWENMLKTWGVRIDRVIHPESDIVGRIYNVLAVPGVSDIRDFANGEVKVFGMNVEHNSWLAGKCLSDLVRAGPPQNTMVAMIFRGKEFIIPHGDEILRPWDHIYVATTRQNFDATLRFMGIEKQPAIQRAFIVGGGESGIAIAELLEQQGVAVKLFEENSAQCEHVAGILKKSVVIHADGSDQETLLQENIEGVDTFLALTDDDDTNLIVSLLARQLGARKVVALVNRVHNLILAQRLGINATVSRRVKTVDAILELVRKGRVLSVRTFREEEAEAIELIAHASSKYVGRALRELNFPRGAIVGAIVRPYGEVIIPRGNAVIAPGDRVVFFAAENCVAQLESDFLATAGEI
ncbi:MAG: Trk system potassium transporter TrkA [Gammaproteobacteria bacterium]|jgi:trk system potassium uptake protein TrkA